MKCNIIFYNNLNLVNVQDIVGNNIKKSVFQKHVFYKNTITGDLWLSCSLCDNFCVEKFFEFILDKNIEILKIHLIPRHFSIEILIDILNSIFNIINIYYINVDDIYICVKTFVEKDINFLRHELEKNSFKTYFDENKVKISFCNFSIFNKLKKLKITISSIFD